MKRIISKVAFLVLATLISALPVLAAEGMGGAMPEQGQQGQKDECLLVSKNCQGSVDSLQQRIDRIRHEIGKGSAVYTQDELRRLENELRNTTRMLDELSSGGG